GSFLLDEGTWHDRISGCGWEFAGILSRDIIRSAANPGWISSGHGDECRCFRRNTGSSAGGWAGGIAGWPEAAVWDRSHWLFGRRRSAVWSSVYRQPRVSGPSG